jgi:phospholipid/cholesterol/gamma-HCH transport system substrate-binding protein
MEERFKFRRVNEITGTLVLIVIAVLIGTAVMTGHSQRWFKSRVTLRITLPEDGAAGIRQGSEVYFLGTLVGSVADVIVDATGRMEAQADIRRDFFRFVRADSSATVKKKFGVAGDSFFEITRGLGQPLPEKNAAIVCNDQVPSAMEAAIEDIRREALLLFKKTGDGFDAWAKLGRDLGETREHLNQLAVRLERIASGIEAGKGTAGRLLTSTALADDAQKILARLESLTAGVEQGKGTVGRLLNDTTLADDAQKILVRLESITAAVEQGKGTVGRLLNDTALADDAQKLLTRANLTMTELQLMATNLNAAAKNLQTGTARLPEITAAVAQEAKDLPGLVQQTHTSMRELERLIEALQRHWLVRKLVNHTDPPPVKPLPATQEPKKQPTNSLRSPRESGGRP